MTQADSYLRAPAIVADGRERIRTSAWFAQVRDVLEGRFALRFERSRADGVDAPMRTSDEYPGAAAEV